MTSSPPRDRAADPATDDRAEKTVALVLDTELDAGIDTVWRALTDPKLVARWLLPGAGEAEVGARFTLSGDAAIGGAIDCAVIASDPPRHLAWRWRLPAGPDGVAQETVVRFDLEPRPEGGVRLRLVHDGFLVPASFVVDAVAKEEDEMIVLLPAVAIMRRARRLRRPSRHVARRGAVPTVMGNRLLLAA